VYKVKRIQRSRKRGWVAPENTVNVARPSRFGNPFKTGDRAKDTESFRLWLAGSLDLPYLEAARLKLLKDLPMLKGKHLACYCPVDGLPCHCDVLLELAGKL
jgi:Domain of unknown function (DUF4326)